MRECKEKQHELLVQIKRFDNANKNYYITANQVLSLAQRAVEIFDSSEVEEKRELLKFVFQNFQLKGKNLLFNLKTSFDTVLLVGKASKNAFRGQLPSLIPILQVFTDREYMTEVRERLAFANQLVAT